MVTHYANYFPDSGLEIQRLAERLGLSLSDDQLQAISATAKGELRHSRFTMADLIDAGVSSRVVDLYKQLCGEAEAFEEAGRALNVVVNDGASAITLLRL